MTDTTTDLPYTISTTADGTPQEELWAPADTADALSGGFRHWYGVTLSAVGPEDEPPVEFLALGHDVSRRALVAAANRWMRTYWQWPNLLNDTGHGAINALRPPANALVVLLRATAAAGSAYEGTWQAVTVTQDVPGAIAVTALDLRGPLENPARLRAQVDDLQARTGTWGQRRRPRVVCLCGSTRYWDLMAQANRVETAAGHVVLAPGCDLKRPDQLWADPAGADALKRRLDRLHRHKIELADEVLVVTDASGYIGSSTRSEIALAKALGKPVRYTDPAHPDQPVVRTITIDCWSVELDNGENLKDLAVGDSVDLHHCVDYDGLWIATAFHGDYRDQVTLQSATETKDCAARPEGIACGWSGQRHAHPVDLHGHLQPRPTGSYSPTAAATQTAT